MLRSLEVVKTNDVTQALNQTIQVQSLRPLLGTEFRFPGLIDGDSSRRHLAQQ
jgi:hypothetical protein